MDKIYYKDMEPLNIYSRVKPKNSARLWFLITKKFVTDRVDLEFYVTEGQEIRFRSDENLYLDGILEEDGTHVCKVPSIKAGLAILRFIIGCGI